MGPSRNTQRAIARSDKANLLTRMPRAFRPKLSRNQVLDLGLCHVVNLDDIATGKGSYQTLWDWVSSVLTWHHAAQAMQLGVDELDVQLQVCLRLIERYGRTGRVAFDGTDYQLAKAGLDVMDQLARIVDRPTAIAAADWSEKRLAELQQEARQP